MAKIPGIGQFGNRVPQGQDVTPMPQLDTQVGDAAQRLGGALVGIANQTFSDLGAEQRHKEAEARAAADRAAQAQTALAHVNIQNGLADSFDTLNRDVLDGKTDKIAATAAWKDTSQKVIADNIAGLPADRAALLSAQAKGIEGRLNNSLFDTFRKRDDQDAIAGVSAAEEGLQRLAVKDLPGAIKQHGMLIDGSPLAPDVKAKRKQAFVETAVYNDFRAQGQAAMQSGDPAAIDRVQAKLAGPDGSPLDPAKKNVLDQTFFGWKQSIEAKQGREADKAEREQTKRFNAATDTLNQGRALVLTGAALAPEFISTMVEQAQGTTLEPQVRELMETQKAASGFANQNPAQRARILDEQRGRRGNPAQGFDPQDEKLFRAAEQIDASLRKKVDDGEAWSAAASVGVVPAAPIMNIGNPQEALQVFGKRMAEQGQVEAWAGRKISPLQPQEAEQLTKMIRTLKPDQAASLLGQVGGMVGDADRIAAIGKQIGDKDGTLGMVMLYANSKTTEGRYTAQLVLEGEQAIKDKTIKVDGAVETGWRGDIAKKVRGAYSNQEVETNIIEAAFKIAAAKGGDVDNAINLASGGIIERNGGKVPLPYGMKEPEFEKRLGAFTPAALADQAPGGFVQAGPSRVPLADFVKSIPDARLVHAGQGAYNVRAGNTLVTNERGQRITLKVGP